MGFRTRRGATLDELEAVYRDGRARFLAVATGITRDEALARDAVHDAFVDAVVGRASFRGEGSLEGWVWRLVVNAARRQAGTRSALVAPPGLVDASTNGAARTADDEVRAAILALPDRQRLAVFLRYYADLDYRAIGQALGIRPGTVAATLNAAHAAVRRRLEEVAR